jgi:hypothetical protein
MKIGIAISLYDKFEELAILVNIIRSNWKNKYIISVCSNYPEAKKRIKELNINIDKFTQGENIFFSPKEMKGVRKVVNLYCRVLDCFRKSCRGAEELGADYVMHLHTDAWPLKEEGLLKIIKYMKKNNKKVATRGFGLTKYGHDCPLGHIDDMFFIYNVDYFRKIKFFDFNTLEMLPTRLSIHGILATLIVSRVGVSNLYLYDNHTKFKYWDETPKDPFRGRANPSALNEENGFLHVNVGSFPNSYGNKVQAMYLKNYSLTKGKYIQDFLNKNYIPKDRLCAELNSIEKTLKLKLRFLGFPILKLGRFGRDFSKMQWYIKAPINKKIKYWFLSIGRTFWESMISKRFGVTIFPEYSLWPESLESFYSRALNPNDYPDKSMVWFKSKGKKNKENPIYRGFDVYW